MIERGTPETAHGWTHLETRRRQVEAGLMMTPAERLAWLEEMLDELLQLVGSAKAAAAVNPQPVSEE